jgi:hypothetical protein
VRDRRVLHALLLALAVIAMLEGMLYLAERANDRVAPVLWGASKVVPDARLGQRPNPRLPDADAAAWRNAARLERAEIVAVGDSQTYGDEVAQGDAWPQQLGRKTGRATYQVALGGYGPVEYERLMDEVLALSPQLVLVGLYSGNDLADAYLSAYPRALAPELRSVDPALVARCEALDARAEIKDAWERTRNARRGRSSNFFWREVERADESSRVLALVRALLHAVSGRASGRDYADDGARDFDELRERAARFGSDLLLPFADARVKTVLTPAARRAVLDTGDARVEEGLRITLEALVRMHRRCAESGCRLAVVGIPSKELVFSERVRAGGAPPTAYAELTLRETLVWERIRAALQHANVPLVDTLPRLRALLASDRNPYRSDWNGHPIAAGNAAIAEAVIASGVLDAATEPAIP